MKNKRKKYLKSIQHPKIQRKMKRKKAYPVILNQKRNPRVERNQAGEALLDHHQAEVEVVQEVEAEGGRNEKQDQDLEVDLEIGHHQGPDGGREVVVVRKENIQKKEAELEVEAEVEQKKQELAEAHLDQEVELVGGAKTVNLNVESPQVPLLLHHKILELLIKQEVVQRV